jgi:hypothetical protein
MPNRLNGLFRSAVCSEQAGLPSRRDDGPQLVSTKRFANPGKPRYNIFDQRTPCRIDVRHFINQLIHKLEALIFLITYAISNATSYNLSALPG